MTPFNRFLINTLLAGIASNTIWFALVFWIYLELGNLTASSIIAAIFPLTSSILGIYFGKLVDSRSKKTSMAVSSALSLFMFAVASVVFVFVPMHQLLDLYSLWLWVGATAILVGAVSNNLRLITLATLVTELVPQEGHDKANGRIGVVNGVAFALTSVFSGLLIGSIGMANTVYVVTIFSAVVLIDCLIIPYQPKQLVDAAGVSPHSISDGLKYLMGIPGLFALILFTTFNNFLAGVFMALADPYGLELVSVQLWGFVWGFLSLVYIVGGLLVSRYGLGRSPLRTLMISNGMVWVMCIVFPLYSNIWITIAGISVYMIAFPFVEAAEQTIIQKVVEPEKQGRVFGTAQSIEMLASPITALSVGPLTQEIVLPFIQEGLGYDLIGIWFGSSITRAIALVFIVSGVVGVIATILAFRSKQYSVLQDNFSAKQDHLSPAPPLM
jgi:DHA3 family multidrug efflux protein-like MFS transporter